MKALLSFFINTDTRSTEVLFSFYFILIGIVFGCHFVKDEPKYVISMLKLLPSVYWAIMFLIIGASGLIGVMTKNTTIRKRTTFTATGYWALLWFLSICSSRVQITDYTFGLMTIASMMNYLHNTLFKHSIDIIKQKTVT